MMSSSTHTSNLEMLHLHVYRLQQASEVLYFYEVSCEGSTNYSSKEVTILVLCRVSLQAWSYQLVPSKRGNKHATAQHF